MCRRVKGQPNKTVIAELSRIKMPELRGDNEPNWFTVTHPGESLLQELHIQNHL
jgi:hypothetical protein